MIGAAKFLISMFGQEFPCLFQIITGYYRPGYGRTRTTVLLPHKDILKSVQYHPLVLYMALVVVLELGSFGLSEVLKRPKLFMERYAMLTYTGVGIAVMNWIFENYMLMRGVDLLP